MTTTVKISKAFNLETAMYKGTIPNFFWESERISLFGCEGVEITVAIYPFGNITAARGEVGAFINFLWSIFKFNFGF